MKKYNKVLTINSFYSNISVDVSRILSDNIESVITDLGYLVYVYNSDKIHCYRQSHAAAPNINRNNSSEIKFIYCQDGQIRSQNFRNPIIEQEIAKWEHFLEKLLKDHHYDCIVLHNRYRWVNSVALNLCQKLDIDCLILERGYYRPLSSSYLFWSGADKSFVYPFSKLDSKIYQLHSDKKFEKVKGTKQSLKFFIFLILNYLGRLFKIGLKIPERDFRISSYVLKFIRNKIRRNVFFINRSRRIILVALQLESDSNFHIYSQCSTMQNYIELVKRSYDNLTDSIKNEYELVFKLHPEQSSLKDFDFGGHRYVQHVKNIEELEESVEVFLTVNSSYTVRMLMKNKKILCMKGCEFDLPGITRGYTFDSLRLELSSLILSPAPTNFSNKVWIDQINKNQLGFDLFDYDLESVAKSFNV